MTIKYNKKREHWEVSVAARHPLTRQPRNLKRIGFKTKAEAQRAEKKMYLELYAKFHDETSPKWIVFLEMYESYVKEQDWSQKTKSAKLDDVKKYTLPAWKGLNVDKIDTQRIHTVMESDMFLEKKPSRQKDILKHIRHCLDYAWKKGFISRNPTPKKKFRIGKKLDTVLTESQVKRLLSKSLKAKHPWYFIWVVALYTGMRNGELYALKWKSIKMEMGQILVVSSWNREDGFLDLTKSGDDRLIDISIALKPILKILKKVTGDTEFVLPRIKDWDSGQQAAVLREFLVSINLPSIRFHDLRATWATILLGKGVPYPVVMEMGGWAETATMDRYLRKAGVRTKGAASALDFS